MRNTAKLLHKKQNSDAFFEELGINKDIFRKAVETGYRQFKKATIYHPKSHGGSSAWGETVASYREDLAQRGWSINDHQGVPTVTHPAGHFTIASTSGNRFTGDEEHQPSSKNDKGAATEFYVDKNNDLFPEEFAKVQAEAPSGKQTWVLLYYYDAAAKELRSELSLPTNLSDSKHITEWAERYIFAPISLDDGTGVGSNHNSSEFTDEVDFDISKKA